jgi:hypothetical protein
MSSLVGRLAVFVVVLVATVGAGVALVGGGGGSPTPAVDGAPADVFTGEDAVAEVPAESGSVTMDADASGTTVLVDAGHGSAPSREQLAPLVTTLVENGATVRFYAGQRAPLNASLREADAFVTFGAERGYTDAELAGLQAFTDAGGRVLVLNEPAQQSLGGLLFGPPSQGGLETPLAPLANQYGLAFDGGYLYNMHEYDTNYRNVYATPAGDTALTEGVDRVVLHESVPVAGGQAFVTTTDRTALSATREQAAYGVAARNGNVVAVGDSSLFGQEYLRRADNEVLVGNLLDFLVSAEKSPADAPQPPERGSGGPPSGSGGAPSAPGSPPR